jgi:hypothetical protein
MVIGLSFGLAARQLANDNATHILWAKGNKECKTGNREYKMQNET